MKNLKEMSVSELKKIGKELKIKNWWSIKKEQLIEEIEKVQNTMDEEELQTISEEQAKENEAVAQYEKNWRKYTDRYNVKEFLEKFRNGEITLDEPEELEEQEKLEEVKAEEVEPQQEDNEPEELEEQEKLEPIKPKRGALIEWNGKAQNICAWGKELEISPNTLYGRIYKMHWSIEKAFTTKPR